MAWNYLYIKNWVKDRNLIPRDVEDGLLTDDRIKDAVHDSIKMLNYDCNLLPQTLSLPLRADQWKYPMPEEVTDIRSIWFIDDSGTRYKLSYVSNKVFLAGRDPESDTSDTPLYYCFPHFQGRVLQFYAKAPNVYDYVSESWITEGSIRTVVDSGINFGKTLDGTRVEPGNVVYNLTDDSYGYVEVMDISTAKTTGTATGETSTNTLEDTGENFTTDGVAVGDIICTPSTGVVTGYAFVTEVGTDTLTYADFQSSGDAKRFESGDTYKVGVANKIRLSMATPHPGLREGATNDFTLGSVKATITGTTFTATTVTGSATTGAEEGDLAIASGGSHGYVSGVDDNELTVDKWIGGIPVAAETVTVREADKYQVETEFAIERVLKIGPTPTTSDDIGSESILIDCNMMPRLPQEDDDFIEIDEKYWPAMEKALAWKVAERKGEASDNTLERLENAYLRTVQRYKGDIYRPPADEIMSLWKNQRNLSGARARGVKDQGRSGIKWTLPA